jgi:hypothetical protein
MGSSRSDLSDTRDALVKAEQHTIALVRQVALAARAEAPVLAATVAAGDYRLKLARQSYHTERQTRVRPLSASPVFNVTLTVPLLIAVDSDPGGTAGAACAVARAVSI